MGAVLPFVTRTSGDWTAAERAGLERLAASLGGGAEAVFGVSDSGDPWCVIKDADEEVLVHVARVQGLFVVHHAVADAISVAADLDAALSGVTGDPEAASAEISRLEGRGMQAFTLFAAVAAFTFELAHDGGPAQAEALPEPEDAPQRTAAVLPVLALAPAEATHEKPVDVSPEAPSHAAAAAQSPTPPARASAEASERHDETVPALSAPAALAPDAAPAERPASAPARVAGGDGGESLCGGAGSDIVVGGAGDDTLAGGGAGSGGLDILAGGEGNDRIELAADALAIGGRGADVFVVRGPPGGHPHPMALGTVLDFGGADRIAFVGPRHPVVLGVTQQADVLSTLRGAFATAATFAATPGQRVSLDYDGDGKEDGFVLLGGAHPTAGRALPSARFDVAGPDRPAPPDLDVTHIIAGARLVEPELI